MKQKNKLKRLWGRIAAWEQTIQGHSDVSRKHPKGFRKPGSTSKS